MNGKARLLQALSNVQDEEARLGAAAQPQTMILRAMNIDPTDRAAADQAFTLGGEFVRIAEHALGPDCWTIAIVNGEATTPGPNPDPMTPGDPPQGTLFAMLLGMRFGREIGRLETEATP